MIQIVKVENIMTKKIKLISSLILSSMFVLSACGTSAKGNDNAETKANETAVESAEITIEHELGTVILEKNPKKVLVFDYGLLDLMENLGVEVTGLPKASIPTFLEKYKDEKYVDIGTLKEPDFEKVFELEPDVIFISSRTSAAYEELNKIAPTIYLPVDNADYMASVEHNADIIGKLFDKSEEASKILATLKDRVAAIKTKVEAKGENALVVLANDGTLSAYGAVSRFGILHNALGFKQSDENIEVSTHGQTITYEYILEKNPDSLFVIDRNQVVGGETNAVSTLENDIVKETNAYKNGKIVYLNPEVWYITSGGFTGTSMMLDEVEASLK